MGAKCDLHSGGQGEYSMIFFPKIYNFFQKVNKFNACNKAFPPLLGPLNEVPSKVFAPGLVVV